MTFQKHDYFLILVKRIKLSWDSVANEEKGLTASKEMTLNSMGERENTILLAF